VSWINFSTSLTEDASVGSDNVNEHSSKNKYKVSESFANSTHNCSISNFFF